MVHGDIRLHITCLPAAPAISLTHFHSLSSPLSLSNRSSLPLLDYIKHSSASGPPLCLKYFSLDFHTACSLTFFSSLHRCLSDYTFYKTTIFCAHHSPFFLTLFLSFLHSRLLRCISLFIIEFPTRRWGLTVCVHTGLCFDYCHTSSIWARAALSTDPQQIHIKWMKIDN